MRNLFKTIATSVLLCTTLQVGNSQTSGLHVPDVSGEYYDYTLTGKPERPYMRSYHNSMFMKFYMADPVKKPDTEGRISSVGTFVKMDFADVMDNIRKIDALTRGLEKVVYVVGWQYTGHDDGYPAFFKFNDALKRPSEATAHESFLAVQKEALQKYNTALSVHVNLTDAYYDSPLWDTYVANDLLSRKADGSYYKWGMIRGLPNNKVCLTDEWEKGYTAWRIDKLTQLCNLKEVKTVHVDAWQPHPNEIKGITRQDEEKAMRRIYRYWRDLGVDLTAEFFKGHTRGDHFIGLQPAAWWNELSPSERLKYGPQLACSGEAGTCEGANDYNEWGFLFGENQHAETYVGKNTNFERFKHEFCTMTLQYVYLNSHKALSHDSQAKTVTYSDGLVADWPSKKVTKKGHVLREGNDVFFPAIWIEDHREIIAYSENGYESRTWNLPEGWEDVKCVLVADISTEGLSDVKYVDVVDGRLTLSLAKGQMVSVQEKPQAAAVDFEGFKCGMGIGGWLTNYKRFNVLPEDRRLKLTPGDLEHFRTYITEWDIRNIAGMKMDHVRLGFDQLAVEDYDNPGVYRDEVFGHIENFVGWCRRYDLNVVLNLHKAFGNYCDIKEMASLMEDPALQDRFIAMWLEFERRFADSPEIVFELLNEVLDVDPELWNDLAARTIQAIRQVNPTRRIVVGSTQWNSCYKLKYLRLYDDPNIIYTFHFYAPQEFTHQRGVLHSGPLYYNRAMEWPSDDVAKYDDYIKWVYGVEGCYAGVTRLDRDWLRTQLQPAVDFVRLHPDKILWCGEFGTIRHADLASRENYMSDLIAIFRENGIPYSSWNYLSTPYDGTRFSLVDDDSRKILSKRMLKIIQGKAK